MESDEESDATQEGQELEGNDAKLDSSDFDAFVVSIGLDLRADKDLVWIAEYAFSAPLPPNWSEHVDDELRIYFYNALTAQSSWSHPLDSTFREVVELAKTWRGRGAEEKQRMIEEHLQDVQTAAFALLDGWSGPYTTQQIVDGKEQTFEYFYNAKTQQTVWDNPVAEHEANLSTRYWILQRALFPEGDASGDGLNAGSGAAFPKELLKLPLHLLKEEQSPPGSDVGAPPLTPGASDRFYTARSTGRESARESARDSARANAKHRIYP